MYSKISSGEVYNISLNLQSQIQICINHKLFATWVVFCAFFLSFSLFFFSKSIILRNAI